MENMNIQVLEANNVLTMSSLEIAELTGKRHDHVMVDIEKMFKDLGDEEGLLNFRNTYTHPQNGQKYKCYNLPKNLADLLLTKYKGLGRVPHRIREESSLKATTVWHVIGLLTSGDVKWKRT